MLAPIILLPGLKSDHRVWAPQAAALSATGPVEIPVAALDSDRIEQMAAQVLASAPPVFALAGCSMGGYVALAVVRQAPERIQRLALLSTSARPEHPNATPGRHAALAQARKDGVGAMARAGLDRDFHAAHHKDPALGDIMAGMAEAIGLAVIERQMQAAITRPDARPALPGIACPTLVICGEDDQITPPDCAHELAAAIPHAALHLLPDCGHCATLEKPAAVTAFMLEWLRQ
ncbi:alpha/beta fold hydrolase [Ferrovibrio sp.]|uniref:alpha/beta fold hydrolase n=1 Tax=Ferrovibrio sp. TaxID=1917215 RepID=UPI003D0F9C11